MPGAISDKSRPGAPLVTYALITGMILVSGPTLLFPRLYRVFGGVGPLDYPWQVFTSAFEHGWFGVYLLPHLIANLLLIGIVGVMIEKVLGAARYLALTLFAILLYWIARELTGMEGNGSSVFIYSYAPVAFWALRLSPRSDLLSGGMYERCRVVLFVMWLVIPLWMGIMTYLQGAHILLAVPLGNLFHISGTIAGLSGIAIWKRAAHEYLFSEEPAGSRLDRAAIAASWSLPVLVLTILVLFSFGVISPS